MRVALLLPDDDVLHGPPVGDEPLDGLVPNGAVAAVHRDVVMHSLWQDTFEIPAKAKSGNNQGCQVQKKSR